MIKEYDIKRHATKHYYMYEHFKVGQKRRIQKIKENSSKGSAKCIC